MTEEEFRGDVKDTNPKDAIGIRKVPMSTVPSAVVMEIGLGMLEGAGKYGRHNYRAIGVRASVYYDATMRHLMAWWEGEDADPASGLPHITKALSSLTVLRDAMLNDKVEDDRPPRMRPGWVEMMNDKAGEMIDRFPNPAAEPYTQADKPAYPETRYSPGFPYHVERREGICCMCLAGVFNPLCPQHGDSDA